MLATILLYIKQSQSGIIYLIFNFNIIAGVMSEVTFFILVSRDIEFKVVLFLGNHKISISVLEFVVRQSLQSVVPSNGYWEILCFLRGFVTKNGT